MPGYGRFETVEEIASSGPFSLHAARPPGESGPPKYAAKVFSTSDIFGEEDVLRREAESFLQAAKLQQSLPSRSAQGKGEGHWAPVHELGQTLDAAYFITDLYPSSGQRLVDSRRELSVPELAWIASCVASGLEELAAAAGGRGHGLLKASNVLVGSRGEIHGAPVVLTEPVPDARLEKDAPAQDLKGLGGLIFQLVNYRPAPKGSEVRPSPEWARLGAAGDQLRQLCDQLLNPQNIAAPLTLKAVKERLAAIEKVKEARRGGLPLGVKIGAAAAVLAVVAAGWFFLGGGGGFTSGKDPREPADQWLVADLAAVADSFAEAGRRVEVKGTNADIAEYSRLSTYYTEVVSRIESVRDKPWPSAETGGEAAKEAQQEVKREANKAAKDLADAKVAIENLKKKFPAIGPDEDPRGQRWMLAEEQELEQSYAAAAPELRAEGGAGLESLASIESEKTRVLGAVADLRARPWEKPADPAATPDAAAQMTARREWRDKIRSDATQLRKDTQALLGRIASERVKSHDRLVAFVADRRKENLEGKFVTAEPLIRAFAAGLRTIDPEDPATTWPLARETIARLTEWLKGIEADFAAGLSVTPADGSEVDVAAATEALAARREEAWTAAAEPVLERRVVPAPDDSEHRALRQRLKTEYDAWIGTVNAALTSAREIERLMALGYGTNEAAGSVTIDGLRASMEEGANRAGVQRAVADVLVRTAELAAIESQKSAAALLAAVGSATAPVGIKMAAWNALTRAEGFPSTLEELDRTATVKVESLAPAIATVPDEQRRAAMAGAADTAVRGMWVSLINQGLGGDPARVDAAFGAMTRLGIGPAQEQALAPFARFNLERWRLLQRVAALPAPADKAQADAQTEEIKGIIAAFDSRVGELGLGTAPGAAAFSSKLKRFREGKAIDLTKEGPGTIGWTGMADDEGTAATYTWKGPSGRVHSLEFRRVTENESAGTATFLATTEVSLGLAADLVAHSGRADDVRTVMNAPTSSGEDSRKGPRVWEWPEGGSLIAAAPTEPDKTGGGWMSPGTTDDMAKNKYYPDGLIPPSPNEASPMNYVTPLAAMYLSRLAGCRVPTSAEWAAGVKLDSTTTPNRRDAVWGRQWEHIDKIFDDTFRNAKWPNGDVYQRRDLRRGMEQDKEVAVSQEDGWLWFRPVDDGSGMRDLVGNVAEFVFEDPGVLEQLPPTLNAAACRNAMKAEQRPMWKVMGASALSAPAYSPEVPNDLPAWSGGMAYFSDVGFRLAFTTGEGAGGSGKLGEQLARLLRSNAYLTP